MENIKFLGAENEVQKIYSNLGLIVPVGDLSTGKSPVVQVLPATSTTDSITATFNVISNAEISALSYVVNEGEPVTVTPQTGVVTISLTDLEKNSGPYTITLTAVNENGSTDSTTHVALQPYTDWAEPESVLAGNKFVADGVEMVGEIVTKTSSDLTVNERTVTVPAGYYAENASASVSSDYIIPTGSTSITTNGSSIDIAQYATVDVAVPNGTETLNATTNNTYHPTSPNIGFSEVVVNVQPVLETVPITPTTSAQTITPSTGYDGIGTANVSAVTSAIDANITAGNIKDGVTILGVTGNYQGGGGSTPTNYLEIKLEDVEDSYGNKYPYHGYALLYDYNFVNGAGIADIEYATCYLDAQHNTSFDFSVFHMNQPPLGGMELSNGILVMEGTAGSYGDPNDPSTVNYANIPCGQTNFTGDFEFYYVSDVDPMSMMPIYSVAATGTYYIPATQAC